ncbi:efflux transporter, RND family, MFP subunit [Thermovibrio ammonificans HB-1]|uniref:Efflux transporter, RND family, MFP subunit n=1 Tax=Thermovibrio ammonificans (strain DSM 15698 / JCM 12110 / HB-1) TaxID=648996 RepID=E8T2K2_THEA1|nr:efflux RND transporter periplasmic adaptor subunit [Thermovibrio ammonificans]ADU97097.1 efflux transporter, RND family, MFP subunit [Thermovibrio ammonificans HB-1]
MKKFLAALIVLALLAAAVVAIKGRKGQELVPVQVVTVKKGEVRKEIEATGIIKPQVGAEIKVGARISGTVVKENVKVGDFVKKGDLIAVIDNRELKEALKRARANLEEIKRSYPERIARQKFLVESAKTQLKQAEAKLKAEEENYRVKKWKFERQKELLSIGYTTPEKFKEAKQALALAESNLKAAKEGVKQALYNLKAQEAELKRLKAEFQENLKKAEADLKQAQIRYSYSYIYAPMSGIISFVSTQKGETVVAGLNAPQFVTILDPKRLENWIYVDETEIGKVKKGMPVEFTVDAYPGKVFKGKVVEIYPKPKILNNVVYYIVVARGFKNVELLRPEMTTHNTVIAGVRKGVLVVPNAAVKWKNGHYVVYKVVGGKVVEVPVKVGWSDENYTQIVEGLKEGDKVALSVRRR